MNQVGANLLTAALLKLHPDIRLNRLANWTCLLAVAPIYVHSLLQLVHLHYWNGLSSGLDRVVEMVKGGRGAAYRRIVNNVENKHIWGIGAGWLEGCWECCEMPGFRSLSPPLLSLSPSLRVIVCAVSASGCWCCGSAALGLCLTHMQLGINTHTRRDPATHPQAALGAELWQPDQHPSCVFLSLPLWRHTARWLQPMSNRVLLWLHFFLSTEDCCVDKSGLSSSGSASSGGDIQFQFMLLSKGMFLLPDVEFQFQCVELIQDDLKNIS